MFQRLKGAIDSRIAEEQARQKAAGSSAPPSRSNSTSNNTVRRSSSRTESPSTKPRRSKPKDGDGAQARGPDPSEFENAFVIEDESEEVASEKPAKVEEKESTMAATTDAGASEEAEKEKATEKPAAIPAKAAELPADVRTKLRKLELLSSKYQDLLRSYRIAHARAISIEPFEKALKEHTPLATISDPDAMVEYLNQLNLKGDMVMDELKRVSAEKDDYKKKFEESEKQAATLREQLESAKSIPASEPQAAEKADTISIDTPTASVKSPVQSVLGLFSPKQAPQATSDNKDVNEEFFSYDDELPKLQAEVKEKANEIVVLHTKVTSLEKDLAIARESSSGLVANLEKATRDLSDTKDAAEENEKRLKQVQEQTAEINTLKASLETKEKQVVEMDQLRSNLEAKEKQVAELEVLRANLATKDEQLTTLKNDLEAQRKEAAEKIATLEAEILSQKETSIQELRAEVVARKVAEKHREKLDLKLKEVEKSQASGAQQIQELTESIKVLKEQIKSETASQNGEDLQAKALAVPESASGPAVGGAKKKNKKKKKGGNAVATAVSSSTKEGSAEPESTPSTPMATDLQAEISRLKEEVADKDSQIQKLQTKRKTEEDLREELENMQDNFLSIGQEHVEAKEKIKELQSEKKSLQETIEKLESEIESHKERSTESEKSESTFRETIAKLEEDIKTHSKLSKASEKVEADLKALTAEYEELKLKSTTLQTDLGAAQQLATSRYRDLTDLRDVLQKAQPELKTLRSENANLRSTKEELATRTSELRRLEARERDLRSDVNSFKKQAADRDIEIKTLTEKVTQETNSRLRAEDQARVAQRDMRKSEAEKIKLAASGEKSASELAEVQEEAGKLRARVRDLEDQVSKLTFESKGLREEVELRGSQYNNAQGLLGSMRDQSAEMAMQLKEAKEQSESLEEELAEVQRLLSERTREAETMRRLLADVDDRADAKVREMRERMEAAIDERDRAEDEASTNGRKRAREVDELKTKIRDFERDIKRATDDRDELQQAEKEWKRRRDELEGVSEKASQEVNEMRSAMGELRNALDGSEKQVREAEKQRTDLRRIVDEANQRYEKLLKDHKALQAKTSKMNDISSRSSIDSGRAGSPNGTAQAGKMDYVYLKTILLQFLEQKDKKRQADLVKTVLGQLLHFDK
ncbi:hypothetical protein BGZ60DRAFT_111950 [Tricladium varicosporioides]|nr:hypothetical protein BGZ60DRAFT_111950 [Hymenoscyphus varicosporioides]